LARIPYLSDDDLTPDQRAVLDARHEVFGRNSAFQRIVTRTPKVARWFLPFVFSLQRGGAGGLLDGRTKEIAVLKTSMLNACAFCTAHNRSLGMAVGLTNEEIEALAGDYEASEVLSDRDKAVIHWSESVTRNEGRRDQVGFERLRTFFNDDEIVELTWVTALFNMINRVTDSLWLDVEESDVEGIRKPITEEGILEFVRRMLAHAEASAVESGSPGPG
jgi:uncharacterized peroxidase-related enzyme